MPAQSSSSTSSSPPALTLAQVQHVAKLARLKLSAQQLEQYRSQLSTVLEYVAKLSELDVTNIEPMAHPTEIMNRTEDDVPSTPMPIEQLLMNAPAVEGRCIAVPKVLDEGGGA